MIVLITTMKGSYRFNYAPRASPSAGIANVTAKGDDPCQGREG
jgi:hypothetical protein